MSSFVIPKVEYVKAAGAVVGIVKASSRYSFNSVWLYNVEKGREMTQQDIYDRFVECFELNAENVYELYSPHHEDETLVTDDERYLNEFNDYIRKAYKAADDPAKLRDIILDLRHFFHSALYQTSENDNYYGIMKSFFNEIIEALIVMTDPGYDSDCWGEFNIG